MHERARPARLRPRLALLLTGFVLMAAGIAFVVEADLGAAPWDVLHQGVALHTPLSFGMVAIVVGLLVFAAWVPLGLRPGIGTVLNVVVVGLLVDGALWLVPAPDGLAVRVAALAGGTLLVGAGAGLYLAAGLGPGPRDGLMTGLAARGLPVRWVRTGLEVGALAVGWLLGGTVGVGTVVVAATLGHIIEPVLRLATPLAEGRPPRVTPNAPPAAAHAPPAPGSGDGLPAFARPTASPPPPSA